MTTNWIADASAIGTFRANPESFRLKYRKHLRPKAGPDNQASAGSALHVALDLWFRFPHSDLQLALAGLRAAWGEPSLLGEKRPLALIERVLHGYAARYPREQDRFTVVANESYVEADVGGFWYCGILDRKIALPDGSEYVMDVKSTGSYLSPDYFRLLSQSDQMIGYVAMERALGRRCDGFMIDAVQIPRTTTAAVGHGSFTRHGPVLVPEWRVERWREDMEWTLGEIARLEASRGIDKPWPVHHNWTFGKPDSYFEFVEQPPELHEHLASQFDTVVWDPKRVAQERQELKLLAKISQ